MDVSFPIGKIPSTNFDDCPHPIHWLWVDSNSACVHRDKLKLIGSDVAPNGALG